MSARAFFMPSLTLSGPMILTALPRPNTQPYADATRDLKKSEFSNLDAFWNQQKRI